MTTLPKKLERQPVVEAIFELRFESSKEAIGDLLPGILYNAYGGEYEKVEQLPLSSVPRHMRKSNENLQYQAHCQLVNDQNLIKMGDNVFSIHSRDSYPGWPKFSKQILDLIEKVKEAKIVETISRFGLRYVNLIESPLGNQLKLLNASFSIGERAFPESGFQVRSEVPIGDFLTITQIACGSTIKIKDQEVKEGILIDIDTIQNIKEDAFWNHESERLNACHDTLKETFFSILLPDTINSLGPKT